MTIGPIGPEFSLLVRCCRWNFANAQGQTRPEPPIDLNWHELVALARRHRVHGLVWNALAQHAEHMPATVAAMLSSDAKSIAATNLGIAAECSELQQAFAQVKAALLFIKGLTVSALAYRSPLLKMAWDIDLLIDPADLDLAAQLLLERGYRLRLPSSLAHLHSWHSASKESVWHRNEGFYVELHTRLADNRRLIPTIDVHSPQQTVPVGPNISLPTLADDELFAYLAVHGASSAWFRLKWISDFAALIHGRSAAEIERLYRRSQELGSARAAGQALLLAHRLFDILERAPALRDELASDRSARLLCGAAMRMLAGAAEPTERRFGTVAIHWTQFLLRPGLSFKLSELRGQAGSLLNRPAH